MEYSRSFMRKFPGNLHLISMYLAICRFFLIQIFIRRIRCNHYSFASNQLFYEVYMCMFFLLGTPILLCLSNKWFSSFFFVVTVFREYFLFCNNIWSTKIFLFSHSCCRSSFQFSCGKETLRRY